MATSTVTRTRDAAQIGALLASPEIAGLIADLQRTRWTGRPGYPIRAMVGLALRPDDPRQALPRPRPSASRVARGVAPLRTRGILGG